MNIRRPHQTQRNAGARADSGRGAVGRVAIVAAAVLALGGCASTGDGGTSGSVGLDRSNTVEARLGQSGGSAARGTVRFSPAANGVMTSIYVFNVNPGDYRMVIHTTGNCTSPNVFSAGPPWVAPGASGPTVVEFSIFTDGQASLVQRVAGLTINGPAGVVGRAVVIHQGRTGTLEAEPGRPNNRIACGVIGPVFRLMDLF
jgi:Cu-Zn family superoxide dismutase